MSQEFEQHWKNMPLWKKAIMFTLCGIFGILMLSVIGIARSAAARSREEKDLEENYTKTITVNWLGMKSITYTPKK